MNMDQKAPGAIIMENGSSLETPCGPFLKRNTLKSSARDGVPFRINEGGTSGRFEQVRKTGFFQ
jgi:hypothetical protein